VDGESGGMDDTFMKGNQTHGCLGCEAYRNVGLRLFPQFQVPEISKRCIFHCQKKPKLARDCISCEVYVYRLG